MLHTLSMTRKVKIDELLISSGEDLENTYVDGIKRISGRTKPPASLMRHADTLLNAVRTHDEIRIKKALSKIIPGYSFDRQLFPTESIKPDRPSATIIKLSDTSKKT